MGLYVQVRVGSFRFLIAADRVREVRRASGGAGGGAGGETARVIECRTLFAATSDMPADKEPATVRVLVAGVGGGEDAVLVVDEVIGMDRVAPQDFRPFPRVGARAAAGLFDAVAAGQNDALPLPRWSGDTLP